MYRLGLGNCGFQVPNPISNSKLDVTTLPESICSVSVDYYARIRSAVDKDEKREDASEGRQSTSGQFGPCVHLVAVDPREIL